MRLQHIECGRVDSDILQSSLVVMNVNRLKRYVASHKLFHKQRVSTVNVGHRKIMPRSLDIVIQTISQTTVEERFAVGGSRGLIRTTTFEHRLSLGAICPVDVSLVIILRGAAGHGTVDFNRIDVFHTLRFHQRLDEGGVVDVVFKWEKGDEVRASAIRVAVVPAPHRGRAVR